MRLMGGSRVLEVIDCWVSVDVGNGFFGTVVQALWYGSKFVGNNARYANFINRII